MGSMMGFTVRIIKEIVVLDMNVVEIFGPLFSFKGRDC